MDDTISQATFRETVSLGYNIWKPGVARETFHARTNSSDRASPGLQRIVQCYGKGACTIHTGICATLKVTILADRGHAGTTVTIRGGGAVMLWQPIA